MPQLIPIARAMGPLTTMMGPAEQVVHNRPRMVKRGSGTAAGENLKPRVWIGEAVKPLMKPVDALEGQDGQKVKILEESRIVASDPWVCV